MKGVKDNNKFKLFVYLSHLFTKSFLWSVLLLLLISFSCVFIYFYSSYNSIKSGNYKMPLFSGYIIVSESMVPTINVNDAIIIKRDLSSNYDVGDIISFESSDNRYKGLTVTHRIVRKEMTNNNEYSYVTKGDNNLRIDNTLVLADKVYGKVVFRLPKIGYVQNFLSKPINMFVCLVIPILLVVIFDLYKIFGYFRKKEF